jgi:glycosyltransferase involved in cell wall biosynthesis
VPLDVDIILCFGRATPLKGFERFIPALEAVRQRCHLVLISVPYLNDTYPQHYDRLIATHGLAATHITGFTRRLPQALCQWPHTRLVAVPSTQETYSNIPLEVALWARHAGPVVATSRVGGFVDQISEGVNGFFLDITSIDAMSKTVQQVLDLSAAQQAAMRQQAYARVLQRYDFQRNFPATLRWFWGAGDNETENCEGL